MDICAVRRHPIDMSPIYAIQITLIVNKITKYLHKHTTNEIRTRNASVCNHLPWPLRSRTERNSSRIIEAAQSNHRYCDDPMACGPYSRDAQVQSLTGSAQHKRILWL